MWKYNNERFIILDTGDIIDTHTWGYQGWGQNYQTQLEIKDSKVYVTYWVTGNYGCDDQFDKIFLGNIVYGSSKPFLIKESSLSETPTVTYDEYNSEISNVIGGITKYE